MESESGRREEEAQAHVPRVLVPTGKETKDRRSYGGTKESYGISKPNVEGEGWTKEARHRHCQFFKNSLGL